MGIFDDKPETASGGTSPKSSSDFSDTTAGSSTPAGGSADFSDVTGGSSSTAPADQSYTVKSGDSLSKIAKHFYGDASKWHRIFEANKDKIKNPDLIHPGQEFTIPGA